MKPQPEHAGRQQRRRQRPTALGAIAVCIAVAGRSALARHVARGGSGTGGVARHKRVQRARPAGGAEGNACGVPGRVAGCSGRGKVGAWRKGQWVMGERWPPGWQNCVEEVAGDPGAHCPGWLARPDVHLLPDAWATGHAGCPPPGPNSPQRTPSPVLLAPTHHRGGGCPPSTRPPVVCPHQLVRPVGCRLRRPPAAAPTVGLPLLALRQQRKGQLRLLQQRGAGAGAGQACCRKGAGVVGGQQLGLHGLTDLIDDLVLDSD